MKNKIIMSLIAFTIICASLNLSSAFFTKEHEYMTIKAYSDVNSPITNMCRPYLKQVVDANTAADVFVLFYFSGDKKASYLFTHQKGSFLECLSEAGEDVSKKCFCYGLGSHQIQDYFSHGEGGLVPTCIKGIGLNFVGHMICEQNAMDKFLEAKAGDPLMPQLEQYDKTALDSLYNRDAQGNLIPNDYVTLLKEITDVEGVNVENTVSVFRSGYQGEGFANTVYLDKVSLPYWMWGTAIGLLILGLSVFGIILLYGTTRWKYFTALLWFLIALLGIFIIVNFYSGTTWKVTTFLLTVPPKFGYLAVSQETSLKYLNDAQSATDEFFRTGQLPYEDASGLSYVDKNGNYIQGALVKAEGFSKIVFFGVIPILILLLNIYLFRKSFGVKKKKRR